LILPASKFDIDRCQKICRDRVVVKKRLYFGVALQIHQAASGRCCHPKYVCRNHHDFSNEEIEKILIEFDHFDSKNKIIVSTEKDAMRLQTDEFKELLKNYPIYYLPLQVAFIDNDKALFNQFILNYVEQNTRSY
jgi:hypothetical protein